MCVLIGPQSSRAIILYISVCFSVYTVNKSPVVHGKHKDRFKRDLWNRKLILHDISGTTADVYLSYVQRNIPPGKRDTGKGGCTADVYLSYVQRNIPPGKLRSEKHSSWLVTFRETFLLVSYVQRNIPPG